jgi:hypothetical protein
MRTNRESDDDVSELIGGTTDRLDTEIMRAAPGRIVSKLEPREFTLPAFCLVKIGRMALASL